MRSNFPYQFQQESLKLIHNFVELTGSGFFLIDPNMRHKGIVLNNIDRQTEQAYQKYYHHYDPLHPSRFTSSEETVVCIESLLSPQLLRQSVFYQEFMLPHNFKYMADMFLRRDGEIVAQITMTRDASLPQFNAKEIDCLRKLQPYVEYTLNRVYLPRRISEHQLLQRKYGLSRRELEVVELILAGGSNKAIATELSLTVPTVKSHLQNIYKKIQVTARTELLSALFNELR